MKTKGIVTVILLVFVAAAVTYLVVDETRAVRTQAHSQAADENEDQAEGQGLAENTALRPADGSSESGKTAPASDEAPTEGITPDSARDAEATARPGDPRSLSGTSNPRVIAYYFHGTQRCATCRKLESYSHEAITLGFAAQLRDGSLEWRVVNTDEPENRHFVDDYKLYTRSLVIVRMQQGKQADWKNLERIWDMVDDKGGFFEYVQREISAYLGTS